MRFEQLINHMKKLVVILSILLHNYALSQNWSIQAGMGSQLFNITEFNEIGQSMNFGFIYDINKIEGVRFELSYDIFGAERITRGCVFANFHLESLIKHFPKKFGIDFHVGFGLTNNSNKIYTDNYFLRGDDAINRSIGFTPTYKLNRKTRLTFNLTLNNNIFTETHIKTYLNVTFGWRKTF